MPDRRIEIIQSDGVILLNLLKGTSHHEKYQETDGGFLFSDTVLWPPDGDAEVVCRPDLPDEEEVARQCLSFIHALQKGRHSLSSLEGGIKALEITRQVETILGTF